MTAWLLDDGPFGNLANQFDPSWRWPAETIHVVHTVAAAANKDRSGRRDKLLALGDRINAVKVHRPMGDSRTAHYLLTHLRPSAPFADKNLGEDVAIALAAMEFDEAVFVAADKQAVFVALAELGPGRVATPLDVWHDLGSRKLITRGQYDALVKRTVKESAFPGVPHRMRVLSPG